MSRTHFGDMMETSRTRSSGALSTIKDSLQMGVAKGFKPFFDAVSERRG